MPARPGAVWEPASGDRVVWSVAAGSGGDVEPGTYVGTVVCFNGEWAEVEQELPADMPTIWCLYPDRLSRVMH